ncbi:MAG TPA: choice-of-anchor Q domain-containing protein [Candidatus Dormibacteraeota bacterium]|nr:choice-of-anchor Q domain-containing protein [Candidatus Dormibacteraeota bacterium]
MRALVLLIVFLFGCSLRSAIATTRYVDLNNAAATPPFTSWATAATNIQDAVDASGDGDFVLVTNGIYASGGRRWFDSGTNRVTLTNAVTLQSVNGPAFTCIVGNRVLGTGSFLTNAARCVYMGNNALLSGFTLTNGQAGTGNYPAGGGIVGGTATNCVLTGNLATNSAGGGAFRATLLDCQIVGNSAASGGGACASILTRCTVVSNTAANGGGSYGGGVYGASTLTQCVLAGNSASGTGGGTYGGTLTGCSLSNNFAGSGGGGADIAILKNCLIIANSAVNGGGALSSTLTNCLVARNTASLGGGYYNGMISGCTVVSNVATNSGGGGYGSGAAWAYNSIVYYNSAPTGSNNIGAKFNSSCTQPNFFDGGITNEPLFVDPANGDFHLQPHSLCINAGLNSYVVPGSTDLDGQPRIIGSAVDMGAFEFPRPDLAIPITWFQQYGLATDGSADFVDTDGDNMNNWQEWVAGTNPTNASSRLAMQAVPSSGGPGFVVRWQSVTNRLYFIQRSTNLAQPSPFSSIASNAIGQSGLTSFTDQSATNPVPYFYRVGIQ